MAALKAQLLTLLVRLKTNWKRTSSARPSSKHDPSASARRQGGFGMPSVMFGIALSALFASTQMRADLIASQRVQGTTQGQIITVLKSAVNNYVLEQSSPLTSGQPVTKGSVTLAAGSSNGQTLAPTVQNLVDMGYLPKGFSSLSYLGLASSSSAMPTYRVSLYLMPAGCSGATCNVAGTVYIDQPLQVKRSGAIQAVQIGAFLNTVGGDALLASNAKPAIMTGPSGVQAPNPDPQQRAGIVGIQVGYGSSGYGKFVTIDDDRDLKFGGNLGVGKLPGCNRAGILKTGEIYVNSDACIKRVSMTNDGKITTNDATGAPTVTINGSTGSVTASSFSNSAGSASISSSGVVTSQSITLNAAATAGAACTTNNSVVTTRLANGNPALLMCDGAKYVLVNGSSISNIGDTCTVNGATAMTSSGTALYCNGTWITLSSRFGYVAIMATYSVTNGSTVAKPGYGSIPACGATGVPILMEAALQINTSQGYANYLADDYGLYWAIKITNGTGAALSGSSALVMVACQYPN